MTAFVAIGPLLGALSFAEAKSGQNAAEGQSRRGPLDTSSPQFVRSESPPGTTLSVESVEFSARVGGATAFGKMDPYEAKNQPAGLLARDAFRFLTLFRAFIPEQKDQRTPRRHIEICPPRG